MSYAKTNYINGVTPLNASNLNKNEIQTEKNSNDIVAISNAMIKLDDGLKEKAHKDHNHDTVYRKISDSYNKQEVDDMIASSGGSGGSGHDHSNKNVLDGITSSNITEWNGKPSKQYVDGELDKKVNVESGKTLTTNDFSNSYKTKLDGLSNYTHPNDSSTRHVTDTEKNTWNSKADGDHPHDDLVNLINELKARIEVLENPATPKSPTFCGQMPFKAVSDISYEDLQGLVNAVEVVKPQTVYAHSGATVYLKTVICAVPKSEYNIAGVIDGAGISILGAYPITEKTLNIPNIGNVDYVICCNVNGQTYNSTTQVKFNLV